MRKDFVKYLKGMIPRPPKCPKINLECFVRICIEKGDFSAVAKHYHKVTNALKIPSNTEYFGVIVP